ncbi:MAG: hypothetical protein AAB721_01290 [Patescibacteria group bacterium]
MTIIQSKTTTYNKAKAFTYGFTTLTKWEECKISPDDEIIGTSIRKTPNEDFIIETTLPISKEQEEKLVKIFENLNIKEMKELLLDDSFIPLAYKNEKFQWFALPEYLARMISLNFDSFHNRVTNKALGIDIIIAIGNQIIACSKFYPTPVIMALTLDYYADRAIPINSTGPHSEITLPGMQFMTNLLLKQVPGASGTDTDVEILYNALKNKNLLPHVIHEFNQKYIEHLKTTKIIDLYIEFLENKKENNKLSLKELINNTSKAKFGELIKNKNSINLNIDCNITLATGQKRNQQILLLRENIIAAKLTGGKLDIIIKDKVLLPYEVLALEKALEEKQELFIDINIINQSSPYNPEN